MIRLVIRGFFYNRGLGRAIQSHKERQQDSGICQLRSNSISFTMANTLSSSS